MTSLTVAVLTLAVAAAVLQRPGVHTTSGVPASIRSRAAVADTLLEWLDKHGASTSNIAITYDVVVGYSLVAAKPMLNGTIACSIPASLAVDFDVVRAHPVVGAPLVEAYSRALAQDVSLIHLAADGTRRIALALLLQHMYFYEREASPWAPYLAILPTPAELRHLPMYWSQEERACGDAVLPHNPPGVMSFSDWYAGSAYMSALGRTAVTALWSKLPEVYGSTSDPAVRSRLNEEFLWAVAICQSHGFANPAKEGYHSLLPLLSLANHHSNASSARVIVDAPSRPIAFALQARHTRDDKPLVVQAGETVGNNYANGAVETTCNDKLLGVYGFVTTDHEGGDCARFTLSVNFIEDDPPPHLVTARRRALQAAGVAVSPSSTVLVLEVSLICGQPLPHDLLIATRAGALQLHDLRASVASATLAVPLSPSHEMRALVRLQSVLLRERERLWGFHTRVEHSRLSAFDPLTVPEASRTLRNLLFVHDGAKRACEWALTEVDRMVDTVTASTASDLSPCAAGPRTRPELAAYVHAVNNGRLGAVDAGTVLPSLARSYSAYIAGGRAGVLLDVGANTGSTSATFMSLFTCLPALYDMQADPVKGSMLAGECSVLAGVKVYAFEPVPSTFAKLQSRAEKAQWAAAGWQGHGVAVSDQDGHTNVYTREGDERSEFASLGASAATLRWNGEGLVESVAHRGTHTVLVLTLASIAKQLNFTEVFLLKVDTEGFDPHVLLGAKLLLQAQRIQWLFFEYNVHWAVESPAVDGSSTLNALEAVSGWLHDVGYLCYLVTQQLLVPLYGSYWHSSYEIRAWSNVLCGLSVLGHSGTHLPSPELQAVVRHYNS